MSYPLASPQSGRVHEYGHNLTAFEFETNPEEAAPNVLLFVAGLTNGLMNVPYLVPLSKKISAIDSKYGKWVLVQALISSSYEGFGTSSLKKDANELSTLVKYLRSETGGKRKKVVLMGHSTGCQDTMQYLTKKSYEGSFESAMVLNGGILQAPVSDSEAAAAFLGDSLQEILKEVYDDYISKGKQDHILPEKFRKYSLGAPITAYRLYSLLSTRGDDDYFSSYLTQEDFKSSFGKVNVPLLVLYGSKDETVPDFVDREKLVKLWQNATSKQYWSPLSKVLKGATHNVGPGSDKDTLSDLTNTVALFIESL
ncbi:uncharacterized protein PRCAT00005431001 [Priceomyces carsonii]|uniref:uncharacterized protein n=1 Tax=Priceomyces carsonii TaxID=28549 RepID=UPI002EDAADF5|nr:unnamed protein product [Priceomyces carsonii]